ncbi:uncharacterized protein [Bemisia tabaci]|uniref:uncharacterized protein isoform X2 n=1 Tax=Bemisia tabaci TaxID=7038 RepID=UPI003B284177
MRLSVCVSGICYISCLIVFVIAGSQSGLNSKQPLELVKQGSMKAGILARKFSRVASGVLRMSSEYPTFKELDAKLRAFSKGAPDKEAALQDVISMGSLLYYKERTKSTPTHTGDLGYSSDGSDSKSATSATLKRKAIRGRSNCNKYCFDIYGDIYRSTREMDPQAPPFVEGVLIPITRGWDLPRASSGRWDIVRRKFLTRQPLQCRCTISDEFRDLLTANGENPEEFERSSKNEALQFVEQAVARINRKG